jgi:gluconolactonase
MSQVGEGIRSPGKTSKIDGQLDFPNGVVLSPDGKTLYSNSLESQYVFAYDVQADGSVKNRRNFARLEEFQPPAGSNDRHFGADGMAVDSAGRLYVTTQLGVQVFTSKGEHLGTIPTSRPAQNVVFAGPDKRTMYVVGRGAVWKMQVLSQGPKDRAK